MKKKDIITVKIDGVRFPNKAFGYVEGEKVVVKNAIPAVRGNIRGSRR